MQCPVCTVNSTRDDETPRTSGLTYAGSERPARSVQPVRNAASRGSTAVNSTTSSNPTSATCPLCAHQRKRTRWHHRIGMKIAARAGSAIVSGLAADRPAFSNACLTETEIASPSNTPFARLSPSLESKEISMQTSDLKVASLAARTGVAALHAGLIGRACRRGWRLCTAATLVVTVASLVGCATVSESPYPLKEGWRVARIDEIGSASDIQQVTSEDCRTTATPAQHQAGQFALVSYWSTVPSRKYPSGWFPRVVPLEAASPLRAGDAVYVNLLNCAAPVVARNSPR